MHNVSSTRVAEFDFLTENLAKCMLNLYLLTLFHLNAFFIKLCPNCDISI